MSESRTKLKVGLTVIAVFSLFVCLSTGAASARAPWRQIDFTPDIPDLGATPIPPPTLIPTLGPGQSFDDATRPSTITTVGDGEFGYGEIAGRPGLYLIWVTDDTGTRYYTVEGNDPQFRGDTRDDDFVDLIGAREETLRQIEDVQDRIYEHQGARAGFDLGAVGLVGLGIIVCGLVTGGACFVPFGVGGLVLVGQCHVPERRLPGA
jgi:hypothetical protein